MTLVTLFSRKSWTFCFAIRSMLVDFTNQLREEGLALDEAVSRAGQARFVPILLTTLTALGGLLPLALERSALYSPLAVVLIGGLVSSTLLARVVTPVLYHPRAGRPGGRAGPDRAFRRRGDHPCGRVKSARGGAMVPAGRAAGGGAFARARRFAEESSCAASPSLSP